MNKRIFIYDTTLRDGCQGIEITFTLEDKLAVAHALDELNVDYVEGGFPFSNPKDKSFFEQCKNERFSHTRIASFGSTRKPNSSAEKDPQILTLLETETPTVTIVGKSWTQHVQSVLGTDLDENLRMIEDSVRELKKQGREVIFDAEHFFDGYKEDPRYATQVLLVASEAGADVVVVCDTNGGTLPQEVSNIISDLPLSSLSFLGSHFHNDCEVAVANSLASINVGSSHVQGTINGWGERCGNANLCSLIPNIALKTDYSCEASQKLTHLTSTSRFIAERANVIPNKRQAYVGDAAFSHKAGQHADVIVKAPTLMEHIQADQVGNDRHIILSELAGKSTIVMKLLRYGNYKKSSPEVDKLISVLKQKEKEGYEYEAAEASFDLLIRKTIGFYTPLVNLKSFHIEIIKTKDSEISSIGRMFLERNGQLIMGDGMGVGPVESMDKTIRNALEDYYPFIKEIVLQDYRVRVINPVESSQSSVRVFIRNSDHKRSWNTVGVHENIVYASFRAIVDSIEYYYNNIIKKDNNSAKMDIA